MSSRLLLVPLDDVVVFPGMSLTLAVDAGEEERVLLVPRHEHEFATVGTVAEVADRVRLPGGARAVALQGLHRGVAGAAHTMPDGRLFVEVEERPDRFRSTARPATSSASTAPWSRRSSSCAATTAAISAFLRSITEPGALADTSGYSPDLNYEQKVQLLQTVDVTERLELALRFQRERLAELQVRKRIRDDVESGAEKQQREYFLRKQMESIRKELGEDDASIVEEYRTKIEEAGMPEAVREQAEKELGRLERMGEQSAESSVIRTYLDWLIAVPWSKRSDERLDPEHAREVLDADHAGLEDVKDRIVEYIAVKKLRHERGINEDKRSGAILTLIGPPGTGKTSIGESIARATGREFVRMSLGGVRDEAEIRGHRRTYIGALPGRLVRALRDAGTMNPVIMLDEVDKVGADWRGDPSSALLEVLDPAQNHSFRDHYLDVELDLSSVMFIATANVADTIPGPLLDRMEVIRFDGYTTSEKVAIARGYLWPRQLERNGLRPEEVEISDELLETDRDRVHARGGRPPARARARARCCARPRRKIASGQTDGAGRDRPRRGPRRARPPAPLPGVGDPHRGPRRGHRPGGDRRRRRRAVRRGHRDAGQARSDPDRPARRRDEGVGADRALLRPRPRRGARTSIRRRSRSARSTCTCRRARSPRTARAPA